MFMVAMGPHFNKSSLYNKLKHLCSILFLSLAFYAAAFSQSLPPLPLQVGGTSNASLHSEGRRRVFKTPVGTWVFYRGPAGISYKHSVDEVNWGAEQYVQGGANTDDFAVTATSTPLSTATASFTATVTATSTPLSTATASFTATVTATSTPLSTATTSFTATVTATSTPLSTATASFTATLLAPVALATSTPFPTVPARLPLATPTMQPLTPTPIILPTTAVKAGILRLSVLDTLTGGPFFAPASERMELQCTSTTGAELAALSLLSGQSGSEIILSEGQYDCKVSLVGYSSTTVRVAIRAFATTQAQVEVTPRSVPVTLRAINQASSEVVSDAEFYVSVWSKTTTVTEYISGKIVKGELTVDLLPGVVYQAAISSLTDVAPTTNSSQGVYLLPAEPVEFKLENNASKTVDFEMFLSQSVLVAAVKDDKGISVPARIEAYSVFKSNKRRSTEVTRSGDLRTWIGFDEDHLVEQLVTAGEDATLSLLPNRSYVVRAFPLASDSLRLPSSSRTVTLAENQVQPLTLTLPNGQHRLTVNPKVRGDIPLNQVSCFAYNSRGQSVSEIVLKGMSVVLVLEVKEKGEEWRVGCSGISIEDEPYFFDGEVKYKATGLQGTVAPVLERARRFYTPQNYQFVSQLPVSFRLPDGSSSLEIPQGAFSENSLVNVQVQSAQNLVVGEAERPLTAFKFDLTVDGQTVTTTERPLLLSFSITQELLDKYGASIEDVYPARFDSKTNSWQRAVGFSYSQETEEISVPVSRFSIWGLLVDLGKQFARQIPYKLRAKNRHIPRDRPTKRVMLSWDIRSSGIGLGYAVEIELIKSLGREKVGSSNGRRGYRVSIKVQATQKMVILKPGLYRYRVAVDAGIPSYWNKFRVGEPNS